MIGLFILHELGKRFGKQNAVLYGDDGLILLKNHRARLADKARNDLEKVFKQFGLKITTVSNQQIVNFLDITLNLFDCSYQTYSKPNDKPQLFQPSTDHYNATPASKRQTNLVLSSNQTSFETASPLYEDALTKSHFNTKLFYLPDTWIQPTSSQRRRQRNIIWYNPPYSKNVRTNIRREFLKLIDKHFPHVNKLHKIFNRNTIKVSYSSMENIRSAIS